MPTSPSPFAQQIATAPSGPPALLRKLVTGEVSENQLTQSDWRSIAGWIIENAPEDMRQRYGIPTLEEWAYIQKSPLEKLVRQAAKGFAEGVSLGIVPAIGERYPALRVAQVPGSTSESLARTLGSLTGYATIYSLLSKIGIPRLAAGLLLQGRPAPLALERGIREASLLVPISAIPGMVEAIKEKKPLPETAKSAAIGAAQGAVFGAALGPLMARKAVRDFLKRMASLSPEEQATELRMIFAALRGGPEKARAVLRRLGAYDIEEAKTILRSAATAKKIPGQILPPQAARKIPEELRRLQERILSELRIKAEAPTATVAQTPEVAVAPTAVAQEAAGQLEQELQKLTKQLEGHIAKGESIAKAKKPAKAAKAEAPKEKPKVTRKQAKPTPAKEEVAPTLPSVGMRVRIADEPDVGILDVVDISSAPLIKVRTPEGHIRSVSAKRLMPVADISPKAQPKAAPQAPTQAVPAKATAAPTAKRASKVQQATAKTVGEGQAPEVQQEVPKVEPTIQAKPVEEQLPKAPKAMEEATPKRTIRVQEIPQKILASPDIARDDKLKIEAVLKRYPDPVVSLKEFLARSFFGNTERGTLQRVLDYEGPNLEAPWSRILDKDIVPYGAYLTRTENLLTKRLAEELNKRLGIPVTVDAGTVIPETDDFDAVLAVARELYPNAFGWIKARTERGDKIRLYARPIRYYSISVEQLPAVYKELGLVSHTQDVKQAIHREAKLANGKAGPGLEPALPLGNVFRSTRDGRIYRGQVVRLKKGEVGEYEVLGIRANNVFIVPVEWRGPIRWRDVSKITVVDANAVEPVAERPYKGPTPKPPTKGVPRKKRDQEAKKLEKQETKAAEATEVEQAKEAEQAKEEAKKPEPVIPEVTRMLEF